MAINPPTFFLKAIWLTHFVLTSWALLSGFLSVNTYWFTHFAVFGFGFWSIVSPDSVDAVLMFMLTLLFSILNDILLLSLYEPRAYNTFERYGGVSESQRNEYRFALGMSITNLILKPVSAFILYRIYQSRATGTEFNASIPGVDASTFGRSHGGYQSVETPNPTTVYGEPPHYQAPTYQETTGPAEYRKI